MLLPIRLLQVLGYESAEETAIAMGAVRLEILPIRLLRRHGYETAEETVKL